MNTSKVWYITGASQGLGLTLVKKLLATGYRVAATSRQAQALKEAVGWVDKDRFLPLSADLTNTDSIDDSIKQTLAVFGRIDVVVNNAGYGMAGTLEETAAQSIRDIVAVNLVAAIEVSRRVIPVLRKQGAGYLLNVGSVAGFAGAPGWSVYAATKAALSAFSEVLALDLAESGIRVTVVEPAGFRTGFLTAGSLAYTATNIEGYTAVKAAQEKYLSMNGQQAGDPEKAAAIFIRLAEMTDPPLHLFLGTDAYHRASTKLAALSAELEQWKNITFLADF